MSHGNISGCLTNGSETSVMPTIFGSMLLNVSTLSQIMLAQMTVDGYGWWTAQKEFGLLRVPNPFATWVYGYPWT